MSNLRRPRPLPPHLRTPDVSAAGTHSFHETWDSSWDQYSSGSVHKSCDMLKYAMSAIGTCDDRSNYCPLGPIVSIYTSQGELYRLRCGRMSIPFAITKGMLLLRVYSKTLPHARLQWCFPLAPQVPFALPCLALQRPSARESARDQHPF